MCASLPRWFVRVFPGDLRMRPTACSTRRTGRSAGTRCSGGGGTPCSRTRRTGTARRCGRRRRGRRSGACSERFVVVDGAHASRAQAGDLVGLACCITRCISCFHLICCRRCALFLRGAGTRARRVGPVPFPEGMHSPSDGRSESTAIYTRTSAPMYRTWETATRKRKVMRFERWDGFTAAAVADASGRTIERNERSWAPCVSGRREVLPGGGRRLTRKKAVERKV